jgi:hypothetical protein
VVAPVWRLAVAVLALVAWTAVWVSAQTLTIDAVGDALKVRVSGFSFLKGSPVARLKDGRSVRVELAAMLLPGPGKEPAAATRGIFALSYDLWEERFAVTTVSARARSVSHLALAAAEAWCFEQLALPLDAFGARGGDAPFWVRIEYRVLDEPTEADTPEAGYTLQTLIDLLSRRRKAASAGAEQADSSPHVLEQGPFRMPRRSSSMR